MRESVDGTKIKFGPDEALKLVAGIDRLIAARGKAITILDLKADKPDDETLLGLLIGRTGHLRAPTVRVGKTLLVGFNNEAYRTVFGG